jgi:hypothetical protein
MEDIKSALLKLYGIWLLADFIVLGVSSVIIWATGSLVDLMASLLVSAAFGAIPFPFNILAVWYVDPLSIIAQIILFIVLIVILQHASSRD